MTDTTGEGPGISWIAGRLSQAIEALGDEHHLIIEVSGRGTRYVQYVHRDPGVLRCESVGEVYLDDLDPFPPGDLTALAALGWNNPDQEGNYWMLREAPINYDLVAEHGIETLTRVHHATRFEQLRFSAAEEVLAGLYGPGANADGSAPSDDVLSDGLRSGRFIPEDNLIRHIQERGEPLDKAVEYLRQNRVLVWPPYPTPPGQRSWAEVEEAAYHKSGIPFDLTLAGASRELELACAAERQWLLELGWTLPWAR